MKQVIYDGFRAALAHAMDLTGHQALTFSIRNLGLTRLAGTVVADGALTERGRRLRDAIEQQTEAALAPVLDAIGPELPALTRRLDEWSAAIVAGGGAPPDVYKRISG